MRKKSFTKQRLFEMFFDVEQGASLKKIRDKYGVSISTASRVRRAIQYNNNHHIPAYMLRAADEYLKTKRPRGYLAKLAIIILKHNYFIRKQYPGMNEKYYMKKLIDAFSDEKTINIREIKNIINYKNEYKILKNMFVSVIEKKGQEKSILKPAARYKSKTVKYEKDAVEKLADYFVKAWKTAIKKFRDYIKEIDNTFESMYELSK